MHRVPIVVRSMAMNEKRRSRTSFAVLWDLDGVLVDTNGYHFAAWRRLMVESGRDLSEAEFLATFGQRNPEILPRLLPGLSDLEMESLSRRKEEYFRESLPERMPLLPGVERLVTELASAGVPQGVASSTVRENLETILPRLRLPLRVCVAAEDVERGKPDPQVFLEGAARLSISPRKCVVVEDAVAGIEAAHRAGMVCVAVATTWPVERLSEAELVVASLERVSVDDLKRLVAARRPASRGR